MMICDNCMNNPKNNPYASGFCNCALPAIEQGSGWFQGWKTQTEKTFTTSNFTVGTNVVAVEMEHGDDLAPLNDDDSIYDAPTIVEAERKD